MSFAALPTVLESLRCVGRAAASSCHYLWLLLAAWACTREPAATPSQAPADPSAETASALPPAARPEALRRVARPSAGCSQPAASAGARELRVGDDKRQWLVSLPAGYDPSRPHPLFFGFHGRSRTHEQCRDVDCRGLEALFGDRALIVYPKSLDAGWRTPGFEFAKELEFFEAVFEQVKREYCVDEARVVLAGMSSGAFFADAVACQGSERFLGIVSVGGGPAGSGCAGAIPALLIHGVDDTHVPVSKGEALRDAFLARNGCSTETEPPLATAHAEVRAARDRGEVNFRCVDYQGCRDGHPVRWCEHGEGGWDDSTHAWPTFGGALLADFLASRLSEPRVELEAPPSTAAPGEVKVERRLDGPVHSIAAGKAPKLAALGASPFIFDGTWRERPLPTGTVPEGGRIESLSIFFGRDNQPRLMGTLRDASGKAASLYLRHKPQGWTKEPSELGPLARLGGGLYGVLGYEDPELVCVPSQLCLVKSLKGWQRIPARAEAERFFLTSDGVLTTRDGTLFALRGAAWDPVVPTHFLATSLCREADGRLWATDGVALYSRKPVAGERFAVVPSPVRASRALLCHATGLWVGGEGGAAVRRDERWRAVPGEVGQVSVLAAGHGEVLLGGRTGLFAARLAN